MIKYEIADFPVFKTGCKKADNFIKGKSSCFNCPYPDCVYDDDSFRQSGARRERNEKIIKEFQGGSSIEVLALEFNLASKAIRRIVKDVKTNKN